MLQCEVLKEQNVGVVNILGVMAYQGVATTEKDKNRFELQVSQFADADAAYTPSRAFDEDDKGKRTVPKGATRTAQTRAA